MQGCGSSEDGRYVDSVTGRNSSICMTMLG
ncbi:hypothetical protein CCACVL1_22953 [Corchorus capsularis]|uniref:Uncharacterized protein n=1 Tax=Corchorus capsularis TaxID=210143 RepID=A0A1R3GVX6_COCAP|nr:hypothetical protein CCACVL1_22953 [Corchorus capsularis]